MARLKDTADRKPDRVLGAQIRPGVDPLTAIDPPPSVRPFHLTALQMGTRLNGWPILVARGTGPALAELMGYLLVVIGQGEQLKFGVMHPKIREGAMAPFRPMFEAKDVPESLHTLLEAVENCDLLLVDRKTKTTNAYVFRYLRWHDLAAAKNPLEMPGNAG